MKMLLILVILCFPIFYLSAIAAIDSTDHYNTKINKAITEFQQCLISKGFENVKIKLGSDNQILIEYENRRYRYEMTALGLVLKYADLYLSWFDTFIIVPKNRNIPIVYISVNVDDYRNFSAQFISENEFAHRLIITHILPATIKKLFYESEQLNNSDLKFDLMLSPGFKVQFSRPEDPAQLQFSLMPSIQTKLANGLQLQSQFILPFYNEFQSNETKPRLGATFLNQFVRLPGNQFISFSIGQFDLGYRGIAGAYYKILGNCPLSLSTQFDYTTFSSSWDKDYKLHYSVEAKYRFTSVDFAINAGWGHFLFNDETWRVEIIRSFGELDLGFMGTWNHEIGFLTGLILNIPFPVSRQLIPREIRVVTPRQIPWNYRYLPYYDGYILDSGNDIETYMKNLFPSFIKNNLAELKKVND